MSDSHTPDDDKTPGRDALALAFYDPMWAEMSQETMHRMPDEWQGRMAALINEFAVENQNVVEENKQ